MDVEQIGQAFADEVFRVFVRAHPNVELVPFNANPHVDAMIQRSTQHDLIRDDTPPIRK